jgi:hypothetical protein
MGQNHNSYKTHCKRGHPLSGENLHVRKSGARDCRICRREIDRRADLRRRGKLPPLERKQLKLTNGVDYRKLYPDHNY